MSDLRPAIILTVILVVMIVGFVGCGGVRKINTGIHIPELDNTQFNDAAYIEGWRYLNEGKPGEAIKRFQESNSVDEKLYVGFGYAFLMQNKLSFAKRNFEKALEINTGSLQAQFGIATMHELLNEKEKAFRIYMKLLTDYPDNSWAKARYQHIKSTETQRYLEQARRAKAENKEGAYITALEKAQTYSPETGAIEIEMAEFYLSQERYEEATRHYENIVERFPDREDILIKLAEVYEKNNKFDSAVIILKKLAALKPGDINIINRINDLRVKFYDTNLPAKFKNIFFKNDMTREDLAALIGHYFERHLGTRSPLIITDIGTSFARVQIIKVCTLGIMNVRPDHSFGRYRIIDRAAFAVVVNRLLKYLEDEQGYSVSLASPGEAVAPRDISPLHKNYNIIKLMVNAQLLKLDSESCFNPTLKVTPTEALTAIRKILNSIEKM